MFCTVFNKHTDTKITRIKQKYSNDNQKARRKIIELQPQNFIYFFQVKLNTMIRYKTNNRIIFHFTGRKVHFLRKKFVKGQWQQKILLVILL